MDEEGSLLTVIYGTIPALCIEILREIMKITPIVKVPAEGRTGSLLYGVRGCELSAEMSMNGDF
jgi:hypothetical protein